MKRILFALILLALSSPILNGQGLVNFSAGSFTLIRISTNSVFGGPSTGLMSGGIGSYYFALFVAPTFVTNLPPGAPVDPTLHGFTFTGHIGTNSGFAGRFNGNSSTDYTSIAGYGADSHANFTVAGWSSNIGRSWAEAQAALNTGFPTSGPGPVFWGNSQVATEVWLGGGIIPAGNIFGANPGQIPGFTLQMIPEPSTLALCGPGLVAYLFFRARTRPKN